MIRRPRFAHPSRLVPIRRSDSGEFLKNRCALSQFPIKETVTMFASPDELTKGRFSTESRGQVLTLSTCQLTPIAAIARHVKEFAARIESMQLYHLLKYHSPVCAADHVLEVAWYGTKKLSLKCVLSISNRTVHLEILIAHAREALS